jgi:hypothetical protein
MEEPNSGKPRNLLSPALIATIFGVIVLVLLFSADQISVHFGLRESQRVVDDFCGAVIAGLLAYRLEYNRWKHLTEKLKTIELMNHHVRNALQVIVDSAYIHGHPQELTQIRSSAKRIDWALREILTGRVSDEYDDPEVTESKSKSNPAA